MEFWDLQDCKDYLDHKAEKVNSIQCRSTGHVTAPDINTILVVKMEKACQQQFDCVFSQTARRIKPVPIAFEK